MLIKLEIKLNYNEEIMHNNMSLFEGEKGLFLLHSNELAATIGKVKVLRILDNMEHNTNKE